MDEARYRLDPIIGRVWAKKGSKPLCMVNGLKQKVNVFGIYDQYKRFNHMLAEKQNTESFIEFLRYLLRIYAKLMIVLDNASWHKSKDTMEFVDENKERIQLVYLPPYSPEMSATEECWRQTRMCLTTNRMFDNKKEMEKELTEFFDTHKFNHSLCNYLGL